MNILNTRLSETSVSAGLLFLRVTAGGFMMVNHGFIKLKGFNTLLAKGFADPFGIGQKASLSLAIFAEVFCAALLIFGLFTRLATIPLIITMLVALFFVHGGDLLSKGESAAVYLAIFLCLLLAGPGKFSVDSRLKR